MRSGAVRVLVVCLACASAATAQLTQNTSLAGFVPITGNPWVADVAAYVAGNDEYALVCRANDGLAIVDVTNPAAASVIRNVPATGSDLKDVRVYQHWAYCVQQSGDVLIVDLTFPALAATVGTIPSSGGHNCWIDEGRALLYYSRSGAAGSPLEIYSLANPTSPQLLSSFDPAGHNSHDAWADGDRCYDFDIQTNVTRILDVTNPSSPVELGTLAFGNHSGSLYRAPGGGADVLCVNDERANGFVHIYDVTNDSTLPHIAAYVTDPTKSVHNSLTIGRYLYISYYVDGLRILDLANPARPAEVGVWDPYPVNPGGSIFQGAWGVFPITEGKVIINEMFGAQGLYIIQFNPPPRIHLDLATTGVGDLALTLSDLDAFAPFFLLGSGQTATPLGTGAFLGVGFDAYFNLIAFPVPPLVATADVNGDYAFSVPSGIPPGLAVDFVALSVKQAAGGFVLSEVGRITF